MIKRLSILNGIAIIGVVLNHAAYFGFDAFFHRTASSLPGQAINWNQVGSLTYYLILAIRQLPSFCVPAFFFVSGFFAAYAFRGSQNSSTGKILLRRLRGILIPYLFWSFFCLIGYYFLGKTYTPIEILLALVYYGVSGMYWFIPCLCVLYLLAIFITPFGKTHWKLLLFFTAIIQFSAMLIFYLPFLKVNFPGLSFLLQITSFQSPLNEIFFFTSGIVFGFHSKEIMDFFMPYKRVLLITLMFIALLNIVESDLLLRATSDIHVGALMGTLSYTLYSITFILVFLTIANIPNYNALTQIGNKSYGIYLLHFIFVLILVKFIDRFLPQLTNYQLLYQPLLFSIGLGCSLLLMAIVQQTPARRFYRYLFG
jgi:fucose 4-O-acetylase-like acetyltransferase